MGTAAIKFIQAAKEDGKEVQPGGLARAAGKVTSSTAPAANATIGGHTVLLHNKNALGQACSLNVRVGMQICIPCFRVNNTCPHGIALITVDVSLVVTSNDCSRWFLYADATVRSLSTSWRASWIYDRLPPLGHLYVKEQNTHRCAGPLPTRVLTDLQ